MELSRRNFLKGAGIVAGAAAVAGLAGCSSEENSSSSESSSIENSSGSSESADNTKPDNSWLGDKPSLSVDDCKETIETDVLVVGSALAGSASAYGALRNGAKVIVLERNSSNHVGGQEMSFLNSKYQLEQGVPEYNKIEVANTLFNQMQYRGDMGLFAVWCNRSGEIFDDLKENVLDPYNLYYHANIIDDLYPDPAVELTPYSSSGIGFSPDTDYLTDFLIGFHQWIEDNGGEFHNSTRAEVLVQDDDGRVTGVIATNPDGDSVYYKASKGVIMCTGSFGADDAMMHRFYPAYFADYALANNSYNAYMTESVDETLDDGLGHKMLCWAGAEMEEICSYQSWAMTGWLGFPYLMVNNHGQRFMNECTSILTSGHIINNQPGHPSYAWQIVPNNDFEMPCAFGLSKEDFMVVYGDRVDNADVYSADTIEELAEQMGVDKDNLVATVERYNELCEKGDDEDYMKAPRYLDAIDDPPYTAYKANYPFFCTTAGVECNTKLQVLDGDKNVIPGLYAAGNTVGYRFGSVYQTYLHGCTNAFAMTHGYVAGETAANS